MRVGIVGCDLGVNIVVVENIDVVDIVVGDIEVVGDNMVLVDFERRFNHEEASFGV